MDISASLIVKGTAGALAASAAVGGGVMAGTDWLDGLWPGSGVSNDVAEIREDVQSTLDVRGSGDSRERSQDPETTHVPGIEPAKVVATGGDEPSSDLSEVAKETVTDGGSLPSVDGSDSSLNGSVVGPTGDQAETSQNSAGGNNGKKGQKSKLTEWDNALINYLKEAGNTDKDIVFDVKIGKSPDYVDLPTIFPDFENDTSKKKLTITATVTTSNANIKGSDHSEKITELKRKNENKDWTWECKIEISKEKKEKTINLENKEKLIGSEGFFNKLAKSGEKDLKIKFIENCVNSRNSAKVKEYEGKNTLDGEKISAEKIFDLEVKSGADWKIKDDEYNAWFLTTTTQQI